MIDPGLYKNKLKELCRTLENQLDLTKVRNERAPEDTTRSAGRNEFEQARRLDTDLKAIRATIRDCWEHSDNGRSFGAALEAQGLILARGDRRDFVVIDHAGGDHALSKRITGATAAETRGRLDDIDPRQLPSVDDAKAQQLARQAEREKQQAHDLAAARAMDEARKAAIGRVDDIRPVFPAAGARVTEPPRRISIVTQPMPHGPRKSPMPALRRMPHAVRPLRPGGKHGRGRRSRRATPRSRSAKWRATSAWRGRSPVTAGI